MAKGKGPLQSLWDTFASENEGAAQGAKKLGSTYVKDVKLFGHDTKKNVIDPLWNGPKQGRGGKPAPDPFAGASKKLIASTPKGKADGEATRVKAIQQVLRNHGYNVKVDGVNGPVTESAIQDYHSSKPSPKGWNTKSLGATSSGKMTPAETQTATAARTTAAKTGKGSGSGGSTDPTLATMLKALGKGGINPADWLTDPSKYAESSVDQQYGPQIDQANQLISDAKSQEGTNQTNIKNWFDNAVAFIGKANTGMAKEDQAAQADQAAASKGILQAFGGDAGAGGESIANTAQNGSNLLAGLASNHSSFGDLLKGLVSGQGASAASNQQATDERSINDMKAQLSALISAKAAALTKGTADARQQNLSNTIAINNANNGNEAAQLNKIATLALLPSNIAAGQLKGDQAAATLAKTKAQTYKDYHPTSSNKGLFTSATANDILNTRAAIIGRIKQLQAGGVRLKPQVAAAAAKSMVPWTMDGNVWSRVVQPALVAANVPGVSPAMLGING